MKLKQILSVLLLFVILIGATACSFLSVSSSDKVETAIYDYLKNKYPDLSFEIKSYTQDTYTSGRYVFHVFCSDTAVDFTVYHSSFLTTDSYSVICANLCMEDSLRTVFGKEFNDLYVESIQWKNVYSDGCEGYRFREMDLQQVPYAVSEVSDVQNFILKQESCENETEAAEAMKAVIDGFGAAGINLEKIVFQFRLGQDTVFLTTDSYSVQNTEMEAFSDFVVRIAAAQGSDDVVKVFYGQDLKKAEYFLTDEDEEDHGGENGNAKDDAKDNEKNNDKAPLMSTKPNMFGWLPKNNEQ